MKTKDIEIEIQVEIERSKPLLTFLKKNAKFMSQQKQVDQYFTPAHRDFTNTRPLIEWLRLRKSNDKYSINYKYWHSDNNGKTDYCDEFESEVTNLAALEKIFKALNMKRVVKVDKLRKIWLYKKYEIAVDDVKGLRKFVEIEYKGASAKSPKKITDEMIRFLKNLGCGKIRINYQGYAFMLFAPKEARYEEL